MIFACNAANCKCNCNTVCATIQTTVTVLVVCQKLFHILAPTAQIANVTLFVTSIKNFVKSAFFNAAFIASKL